MANTFKLSSKAGVTSADVIYTVATSTTTIILGLILGNTTTSQVTATVTLTSDTGNRTNANDEVNQPVELITNAPIPAGSSLELLAGNKVVLEASDIPSIYSDVCINVSALIFERKINKINKSLIFLP